MKYRQRTFHTGNIIETILNGRGIENIEQFLNPTNADDTKLELVKNLEEGVKLIKDNLGKKILILVDSDCDGYTSASIMYQYLKAVNPDIDIHFYVHETKLHGLTNQFMDYIKDKSYDLIIIPDAGSNDVENIELLERTYDTRVLVIDHHEIEKESPYGVIINNQACENTNSNLTGAGMAYIFCRALEREFRTGKLEELADLAMIGLIGDSANLRDNEVRFLCMNAIKGITNNLLKTFYQVNGKGTENLIIKDLSFSGIIPMINAVVRVGTLEERIQLFQALSNIDCDYTTVVEKRKLNKETRKYEIKAFEMNAYEYMVEVGTKAKSRQDSITKKVIKSVEKQYDPSSGIQLFIIDDNEEAKGITGLIANKLSGQYQQPCIVMWESPEHGNYIGSLRGNVKVLKDFKQWCTNTGLFSLAQGHPNAAGIILPTSNLEQLREMARNVEAEEYCNDVDLIYKGFVNVEDVKIVNRYKHLWYGGVEEPLFAVEQIEVPKSALVLNKSTMKFYVNGLTYIKFRTSESEFNSLKYGNGFDETVTLNLVGRFDINTWNGNCYPQFVIDDYEVAEKEVNLYGIFA
ncbi:MAG TPA: hypothetical protein DCW90_06420 [Lachnospiraceae bacterium]|nr:DHH family phosphoesterase [uncultured Lachnoclostridium sp.]HAU85133.1 hypothetical protein [Lachnospiraceae bacterium]